MEYKTMLELTGAYNKCKIFTDNVDSETISQIYQLLNQQFVSDSQIRIMPDTHSGTGCVIGTTMTIKDKVCPNLVGVDIGCGMLAVKLGMSDIDLDKLDDVIKNHIPYGFSIYNDPVAKFDLSKLIAPTDTDRALKSLGTLGGGNHFIECDKDSSGKLWLVIHTGSRRLGVEVCKYYQDLAYRELTSRSSDETEELIRALKNEGKHHEIEKAVKESKSKQVYVPKELSYLYGEGFENYIHDMKIVQMFASANRWTIIQRIFRYMGWGKPDERSAVHTIHNYIDTDYMILRKGSISARSGEVSIIPMNMRDGSLICTGKGNPDWNFSAPHGAGRILSRSQAKETVSLDEYKDSMAGIYTTCVCQGTIDESPMVYKPMEEIKENINDTVEINDIIKPVYNFKAC